MSALNVLSTVLAAVLAASVARAQELPCSPPLAFRDFFEARIGRPFPGVIRYETAALAFLRIADAEADYMDYLRQCTERRAK